MVFQRFEYCVQEVTMSHLEFFLFTLIVHSNFSLLLTGYYSYVNIC